MPFWRLRYLEHSFLGLSHCALMLKTMIRKWAMWWRLSEVEWVSQECHRDELPPKQANKHEHWAPKSHSGVTLHLGVVREPIWRILAPRPDKCRPQLWLNTCWPTTMTLCETKLRFWIPTRTWTNQRCALKAWHTCSAQPHPISAYEQRVWSVTSNV